MKGTNQAVTALTVLTAAQGTLVVVAVLTARTCLVAAAVVGRRTY